MNGSVIPQSGSIERVRELLDPYDRLPLECDGFVRVATYVLKKAGIPHTVYTGQAAIGAKTLPIHFWIVLDDCIFVDYRLRMWFGEAAPHGIISHDQDCPVIYSGRPIRMKVDDFTFAILTLEAACDRLT